ncbi:MAG: hypothetical protein ACE5FC_10910 [Myxococcota bacterium]
MPPALPPPEAGDGGAPCCEKGSWGRVTPGGGSGLSGVSVKDLKAEIDQCKDAGVIKNALNSEIASRRKARPAPITKPKAVEPPARLR